MKEVLELDMDELDLRRAVIGTVALAVGLALMGALGPVGIAAGIAAIFVVAGDSDETRGPDSVQAALVVGGAAVTLLVGYAAGSTVAATITIAAVTLVATLVSLAGPRPAAAGVYALLWAVLTLSIGATDESPVAMAGAFLAGGAIALAVLWLAERVPAVAGLGGVDASRPDGADDESSAPRQWAVEVFAMARSVAAGGCVALGYWLFEAHPIWAVLTFVLVLQPPKEEATVVAVGRTLGTTAGVIVGIAVAGLVGDRTGALVAALVLCAFSMLATKSVNYALSTAFTTALLLLAQRLLHEDVFSTGWQRLLATVLGVAAAFAVMGAMNVFTSRHAAGSGPTGEAS